MSQNTTTLYRPIGTEELQLIASSNYTQFPPRLRDQPLFYPVLSMQYAMEIARDWNANYNKDRRGYVTRFQVESSFLEKYEIHLVGASRHQEYWIPAKDLDQLNQNIQGTIEVIAEFCGIDSPTIQKNSKSTTKL